MCGCQYGGCAFGAVEEKGRRARSKSQVREQAGTGDEGWERAGRGWAPVLSVAPRMSRGAAPAARPRARRSAAAARHPPSFAQISAAACLHMCCAAGDGGGGLAVIGCLDDGRALKDLRQELEDQRAWRRGRRGQGGGGGCGGRA